MEHLLTPARLAGLAGLAAMLVVDDKRGGTRLHRLGDGAIQASPGVIKAEIDKLHYLRGMCAHELDRLPTTAPTTARPVT